MLPGQYVIIIGTAADALQARAMGLSLRDTILILLPGATTLFAYLFRAPLDSTVAKNVINHGCGALNIDGCRTKEGRWPTNLVLVHVPTCRHTGFQRIQGNRTNTRPEGDGEREDKSQWRFRPTKATRRGFSDEDDLETIAAWECQPDCPALLLDNMTKHLHGAGNVRETLIPAGAKGVYAGGWNAERVRNPNQYGNYGGTASRFFPQFPDLQASLVWLDRLVGSNLASEEGTGTSTDLGSEPRTFATLP